MQTDAVELVTELIAQALGVPPGRVTEADGIETLAEWDSLGHLNILTSLDRRFQGKVAHVPGLAKATSVKAIVGLLQEHKVI